MPKTPIIPAGAAPPIALPARDGIRAGLVRPDFPVGIASVARLA